MDGAPVNLRDSVVDLYTFPAMSLREIQTAHDAGRWGIKPTASRHASLTTRARKIPVGDVNANPRETFLYYYRKNNLEGIRKGNWKLVFAHPGRTYHGFQPGAEGFPGKVNDNFSFEEGLYDLRRDPGEQYDVKAFYPEVVVELKKLADEAREDLGDDLTGNPGKNRREPGRIKN